MKSTQKSTPLPKLEMASVLAPDLSFIKNCTLKQNLIHVVSFGKVKVIALSFALVKVFTQKKKAKGVMGVLRISVIVPISKFISKSTLEKNT